MSEVRGGGTLAAQTAACLHVGVAVCAYRGKVLSSCMVLAFG